MIGKNFKITYRIVKNFGGKKVWQNSAFETLAKKTLAHDSYALRKLLNSYQACSECSRVNY